MVRSGMGGEAMTGNTMGRYRFHTVTGNRYSPCKGDTGPLPVRRSTASLCCSRNGSSAGHSVGHEREAIVSDAETGA